MRYAQYTMQEPLTYHDRRLPPIFFHRLLDLLPPWMADPFRNKQRQLQLIERRIQRRFLAEYRAQVRSLEPLLRKRGELLGKSCLDAFVGHHAAKLTYAEMELETFEMRFLQQKNVQELMRTLDPLIQPVLTPFVEGVKTPINATLTVVESDVKRALVSVAVASIATGFLLGRISGSWGGNGGRRGNSGGDKS